MKIIAIILDVILLLITVFISAYFLLTAPQYDGEFSLDDFSNMTESFPFAENKAYSKIIDDKSAEKTGKM